MKPVNRKAKIAYLLKTYPKVSETFILQEILALERDEFDISIFALQRPTDEISQTATQDVRASVSYLDSTALGGFWKNLSYHGIQIVDNSWRYITTLLFALRREERDGLKDFNRAIHLVRGMRRLEIEHLHAHFASVPAGVAELVTRLSRANFSISAHAKDIYLSSPTVLRRKIASAHFVVTCTEYNRRYLQNLNHSSTPIHRVYHGLNSHRFVRDEANTLCSEPPLILSVGRLREKKGFPCLIQACAILKQAGFAFRCEIVGYGPDREQLLHLIEQSQLNDRVTLRGTLAHEALFDVYRETSIFVLPSRIANDGDRDGIPNVLMEAMAMEIPVVSTDISGISELVQHEINGLLVKPDDAPALAAMLMDLLGNPELQKRLGKAGQVRVRTDFSAELNIKQLAALLVDVSTEKHNHSLPQRSLGNNRYAG